MNPYQCVIWDWNGTLADDLQASLQATNDILRHRGKPPITLEQYYAYMDSPISRFYEHLFDLRQVTMLEIGREFSQYYPKYFHHLHDGVPLLLQRLQANGIRQVILSASHRKPVEENTARFGIRQYFDEIIAAEDQLANGKIEQAKAWISHQSIPPENMILIGDTLHDYDVAQAIGTDCILCAFGHQAEADLRATGVPVVTAISQLEAFLLEPALSR